MTGTRWAAGHGGVIEDQSDLFLCIEKEKSFLLYYKGSIIATFRQINLAFVLPDDLWSFNKNRFFLCGENVLLLIF